MSLVLKDLVDLISSAHTEGSCALYFIVMFAFLGFTNLPLVSNSVPQSFLAGGFTPDFPFNKSIEEWSFPQSVLRSL